MPTPELRTYSCDELLITIGSGGLAAAVEHADRPGANYLKPQRIGTPALADADAEWELAEMLTDVDETEARYVCSEQPELKYTIRNSFAAGWLQRHVLVNSGDEPVSLSYLWLDLVPADGHVGWGSTTATESYWTIQPDDGSGPLLAGELTQGSVGVATDSGFYSPALVLEPGRSYVLQWRIGPCGDAAEVAASRQLHLPGWTDLPAGVPYEVADPDTAVVVEEPLLVQQEDAVQVVLSDQPGRYPVELRSARGTGRLELSWVPSTDDLISRLSDGWLSGRRSSSGVPILPGGGAALGLQHAAISRLTDRGDEAEEALALHAARTLERDRLSIMELAFLAQEAVRTGDPDPLERARAGLLELTKPQPGLGMVAIRACLAELTMGGDPTMIISHLREVLARPVRRGRSPKADDAPLRELAARLELTTVVGPSGRADLRSALLFPILEIGAQLGSGLPGRRLGAEIHPAAEIYAAAVLDLTPDDLGVELEHHWPTTPHVLAERIRTAALAEVLWPTVTPESTDRLLESVGWLVLGRPVE